MEEVIHMMEKFVSVSGLKEFGFNFDKKSAQTTFYNMLTNKTALIIVAENNGIVGTMGIVVVPWIADLSQLQVSETWFWVEPEHRGKGVDRKMVEFVELKSKGLFSINLMAIENEGIDKISKYYKRKGFLPVERTFIKRL